MAWTASPILEHYYIFIYYTKNTNNSAVTMKRLIDQKQNKIQQDRQKLFWAIGSNMLPSFTHGVLQPEMFPEVHLVRTVGNEAIDPLSQVQAHSKPEKAQYCHCVIYIIKSLSKIAKSWVISVHTEL